ncbi:Disintegrin and metalloproteinase domain-containing protein 12 [Holothuria leucospilota]|uniref:Disintegrin and metalloproteinase domain-containing protein 12 n=1 Tax=Holothuria leucospilota TaxID=206669 RepID=A0A9Q1BHG3_HOLLE|nr:Disintegrin and metalloproteinase domain-containing protein 12 [Holothuria leucospilota]
MDWGNIPASKLLLYIFVFGILIISFCTTFIDAYSLQSRTEQLSKITKYDIITPKRLDGRYRRDATTLQDDGHLKTPSFILPIEGEEYILDLHLNEMLFADGFIERTYTEDLIPIDKLPHRTHHCYYHGEVRGSNSSLVALSTCDGLSGLIYIDGNTFYLEPLQGSSSEHLIYRSEHVIRDKPLHTFEEDYPKDFIEKGKRRMEEIEMRHRERVRRDTREEVKYIELVLVADSKLYEKLGTTNKVNQECKDVANIMDMIYLQLNTRVALASVVIWTTDPFVVSTNPSTALGQFQRWREKELVPAISHDNAQLLTGLNFDGSTVGMAALGTMCSRDQSCGVSQDHGNHANDVASTISHEMGHNLGLNHDSGKGCDCESPPNVGCVMSASSGSNPPLNWSSCSREEFGQSLDRGLGACMFNYPKVIFQGPICQNGFLEEGEECDCGPADVCDNPCCVAETCRLHENATCASGACCENCQLKERGNLCRPMMNECDLPEYCSGTDEECPGNVYRQNGVSCNHGISDIASCFNGMCMSYDDQCSYIWGEGATVAHPKCWRYNQQGNGFGNCGHDENGRPVSCKKADKMCGKLLCEGGAGFPILSSLASASQGFIWDENGAKRVCKAASLDQGEDIPDPGYVADGSPCAANMFCYEHECINHTRAGIVSCPENCNGNGICNSENHCHCNDNWGPPTCRDPGHGGSVDSGPTMPIPPEILTTVKVASTPPYHTSPPIQHGTGYSVTSLPPTTSIPPTTSFYASPGSKMSFSTVVMMSLVVLAILGLVLLMTVLFWKRNSIRGRFKLQTISKRPRQVACKYAPVKKNSPSRNIYRPKHPPPARPSSQRGITKVVIEHPDHISEAPPSYESHYRNLGDQLSPVRVAPAPPSKPEQRQVWDNDSPVFFPAIKYQRKDDAVMYDEPPNVTCVDPSIPRFNPPPSPPAKPDKPLSPFERPRPVSLRSNSIEGPKPVYDEPPTPPIKPDNSVTGLQFRLPSTGEEAEPISPVRVAPKPPSFKSEVKEDIKPAGQEILKPVSQTPMKPPSQVPPKPPSQAPMKPPVQAPPKPPGQTPLKPPSQTPLKPPSQTPPKPPGQTPPKPPGQIPLKPPGQTPLKPPSQIPLKPVVENHAEPAVLPSSKPVPPPKKPAVSSKPAVSNKPAVSSKPVPTAAPRQALRPVRQQNNSNNSASSSSPSMERDNIDESTVKLGSSFRGGLKPSVAPPEPPKKPSEVKVSAKPSPPPKPVVV